MIQISRTEMTILTPGVVFISRTLGFLGIFSVGAVTSRHLLEQYASISVPTWLFLTISVTSLPGIITCRILYKDWRDRREAARLGARLAPKMKGKWIGNLDILRDMVNNFWTGYPGTLAIFSILLWQCWFTQNSWWSLGGCWRIRTCIQYEHPMGKHSVHNISRTYPAHFSHGFQQLCQRQVNFRYYTLCF